MKRNFLLGCAVWSYKGWLGSFFPDGSQPRDFLRLYSQRLTAVEGNTTFYAVPDADTVSRWAVETPSPFEFCLKLPRELTHRGKLSAAVPGALQFLRHMQPLRDRMGPVFAQLPPGYSPALMADLEQFLQQWPRSEVSLALEVRHPDWFVEPQVSRLNQLLEQLGVGRVLLDTRPVYDAPDDPQLQSERRKPRLPLQPIVTASFSLIRFISHPDPAWNQVYLQEWVLRVGEWLQAGKQVYFFVHCPVERQSPGTAREFQRLLEQEGIVVPPLPWNELGSAPAQLSLF